MGDLIGIGDEIGPMKFRLRFVSTGNETVVMVDHDKQDLFRTQDIRSLRPDACPFLRFGNDMKAICSIHGTRPDLCRMYSCFRLLVVSP
jgi:Fe-S-cluster containining protein